MLRIVPDTNVLVSALGWKGNEYRLMEKCFKREILPVTSLDILHEFKEAASKPELGFTSEEADEFITALIETALVVQPTEKLAVCRDPEDDKFLEAALEGKAGFIISGDKDLLALKRFRNINIVTAAEFMRQAEKSK
jgi:uncharacterized protein